MLVIKFFADNGIVLHVRTLSVKVSEPTLLLGLIFCCVKCLVKIIFLVRLSIPFWVKQVGIRSSLFDNILVADWEGACIVINSHVLNASHGTQLLKWGVQIPLWHYGVRHFFFPFKDFGETLVLLIHFENPLVHIIGWLRALIKVVIVLWNQVRLWLLWTNHSPFVVQVLELSVDRAKRWRVWMFHILFVVYEFLAGWLQKLVWVHNEISSPCFSRLGRLSQNHFFIREVFKLLQVFFGVRITFLVFLLFDVLLAKLQFKSV